MAYRCRKLYGRDCECCGMCRDEEETEVKEMAKDCYQGFGPNSGIIVDKKDALAYALNQWNLMPVPGKEIPSDVADMLEEAFFSGAWI